MTQPSLMTNRMHPSITTKNLKTHLFKNIHSILNWQKKKGKQTNIDCVFVNLLIVLKSYL